ncbi:MAG: efflux RND transporter periplasmic adaptor subunit [Candidatus Schekmanbacteria bacterium]|nr:efflux RND transporter periplasmic adaptor subunit [Candidatus Schekmanbacteria bacterium]
MIAIHLEGESPGGGVGDNVLREMGVKALDYGTARMSRRLIAVVIAGGLCLLAGLPACTGGERSAAVAAAAPVPDERPRPPRPQRVQVVTVRPQRLETAVETTATLMPAAEVEVFPKVTGVLAELLAEEGSRVRKDQILGVVEDGRARTTAGLRGAELANQESRLRRTEVTSRSGLTPETQFEQMRFEVDFARYRQELAALDLEDTRIRSPISGTVTRRYCQLGQRVTPDDPVFLVTDLTVLKAQVYLPQELLGRVAAGSPAEVVAAGIGATAEARLERIDERLDPRSATARARLRILAPAASPLRPGMAASVRIPLAASPLTILVPRAAFALSSAADQVFTVRQGTLQRRRVTARPYRGDLFTVEGDLAAGEQVAVGTFPDGSRLVEGAPVTVEETPLPPLPARVFPDPRDRGDSS